MIVIVDYGVGNLGSIQNMLKKIGAPVTISRDFSEIRKAKKLILPGVGAFDTAAKKLAECDLIPVLNECVFNSKIPILGLCVGFQLMTACSQEGSLPGLGWFQAKTVKFKIPNEQPQFKVPHMGWNTIIPNQESRLLHGFENDSRFYFVHSYHVESEDSASISAQTKYGYPFVSAMEKGNIAGVQFHPEKSHRFGMKLFKNFVESF